MTSHPEILVQKKSDSSDEDKSVHDTRLLIPTLKAFFRKHSLINPKIFLEDAAFDTMELYKVLLTGNTFGEKRHFQKAYIPLNIRSGPKNSDYTINENGIPCCPQDVSIPMKYECSSKTQSGVVRYKFVCPKCAGFMINPACELTGHAVAKTPCTTSRCGCMVYIYPGAIRGTEEWDNTYKIRTVVERDLSYQRASLPRRAPNPE